MPRHRFTDTRQRIEQAATQLFVARGITETSVRDITRAVGISEGALYRHFESKDDLVWQTFEQGYTSFARELESLAARETTARQKVAAMIRGFCRAHDANPTHFNFLVFVQHGQLAKLAEDAPTPVTVMRAVLARGRFNRGERLQLARKRRVVLLEGLPDQILLALEMPIERPFGNPDLARDVANRCFGDPPLNEKLGGGPFDALARVGEAMPRHSE